MSTSGTGSAVAPRRVWTAGAVPILCGTWAGPIAPPARGLPSLPQEVGQLRRPPGRLLPGRGSCPGATTSDARARRRPHPARRRNAWCRHRPTPRRRGGPSDQVTGRYDAPGGIRGLLHGGHRRAAHDRVRRTGVVSIIGGMVLSLQGSPVLARPELVERLREITSGHGADRAPRHPGHGAALCRAQGGDLVGTLAVTTASAVRTVLRGALARDS